MLIFTIALVAVALGAAADQARKRQAADDRAVLAEHRCDWYAALADRRGRIATEAQQSARQWEAESRQWQALTEFLVGGHEPAGVADPMAVTDELPVVSP